jgi:hypothetical protein
MTFEELKILVVEWQAARDADDYFREIDTERRLENAAIKLMEERDDDV